MMEALAHIPAPGFESRELGSIGALWGLYGKIMGTMAFFGNFLKIFKIGYSKVELALFCFTGH